MLHDPVLAGRRRAGAAVYPGDIVVTAPEEATLAFCRFARQLVGEASDDLDPQRAQDRMPVERYVEILSTPKTRFIHDPRSKDLVRDVLAGGLDLVGAWPGDRPPVASSSTEELQEQAPWTYGRPR